MDNRTELVFLRSDLLKELDRKEQIKIKVSNEIRRLERNINSISEILDLRKV